jgi:hypothetical protein
MMNSFEGWKAHSEKKPEDFSFEEVELYYTTYLLVKLKDFGND